LRGLDFGDELEFQGSWIANAWCFKAEGATIWGFEGFCDEGEGGGTRIVSGDEEAREGAQWPSS